MNQCILIGKIVGVIKANKEYINLKIAVKTEGIQIFTVRCFAEMAKLDDYQIDDIIAVKGHLLMKDEIHIIAEKIAVAGQKNIK